MRTANQVNPLYLRFRSNVLTAQAYGAWLYVQLGDYDALIGAGMPFGIRIVWRGLIPKIEIRRHKPCRVN